MYAHVCVCVCVYVLNYIHMLESVFAYKKFMHDPMMINDC